MGKPFSKPCLSMRKQNRLRGKPGWSIFSFSLTFGNRPLYPLYAIMKRTILFCLSLFVGSLVISQFSKEVSCNYTGKKLADTTYEIHMTRTIGRKYPNRGLDYAAQRPH